MDNLSNIFVGLRHRIKIQKKLPVRWLTEDSFQRKGF